MRPSHDSKPKNSNKNKNQQKDYACRFNNTLKLKEVINTWEEKDGITAKYTTITYHIRIDLLRE